MSTVGDVVAGALIFGDSGSKKKSSKISLASKPPEYWGKMHLIQIGQSFDIVHCSTTIARTNQLQVPKSRPIYHPSQMSAPEASKSFAPKTLPKLDPPKDDPITVEELAKCDGMAFRIAIFHSEENTLIGPAMQGLARAVLRG